MALVTLHGLWTLPTGVTLLTGGSTPTSSTAGGTINVGQVDYTGGNLGSVSAGPTSNGSIKDNWAKNSATNPIYTASPVCGDGVTTVPAGNGNLSGTLPVPCNIMGVDHNLRTPYITTWSLGIQRALTNNLSLDVTYVGNHATKLVGLSDLNQPRSSDGFSPGWGNPATAGTPANDCLMSGPAYGNCDPASDPIAANELAAQPYHGQFPYLAYISWLSNSDLSNYNSLQVSMTQRTVHGLSFVLGYTYAHALGESPDNWSFLSATDTTKPRSIYGTTEFDVTHRFTFSATYAIPGMNA